ncbi:MAG: hypothetical protein GY898_33175 [Proteobacteria bacterium]|nr:hypothetical protein [Pseudomonadota bacterium]
MTSFPIRALAGWKQGENRMPIKPWSLTDKKLRAAADRQEHPVIAERIDALADQVGWFGKGFAARHALRTLGWMLHVDGQADEARAVFALLANLTSIKKMGGGDETYRGMAAVIEAGPSGDPDVTAAATLLPTEAADYAAGMYPPRTQHDDHVPWAEALMTASGPLSSRELRDLGAHLHVLAGAVHDGLRDAAATAAHRDALDRLLAFLGSRQSSPEGRASAGARTAARAAGIRTDPKNKDVPPCFDPDAEPHKRIKALKAKVFKKYRPGSSDCLDWIRAVAITLHAIDRDDEAREVLAVLCGLPFGGDQNLWGIIAPSIWVEGRLLDAAGQSDLAGHNRLRTTEETFLAQRPDSREWALSNSESTSPPPRRRPAGTSLAPTSPPRSPGSCG